MEENQTQPVQTPPVNPTPSVAPVETPKKPANKASVPRLLIAFLLGATAYALGAGIYNISNRQAIEDSMRSAEQELQQGNNPVAGIPQAQEVEKEESISSDDLKKFVNPADCSTKSEYADLGILYSLGEVRAINLYDGVTIRLGNSMPQAKWKSLPVVVDYKCDIIKITDIKIDDRINVYTAKTTLPKDAISNVRLLQKASL